MRRGLPYFLVLLFLAGLGCGGGDGGKNATPASKKVEEPKTVSPGAGGGK